MVVSKFRKSITFQNGGLWGGLPLFGRMVVLFSKGGSSSTLKRSFEGPFGPVSIMAKIYANEGDSGCLLNFAVE